TSGSSRTASPGPAPPCRAGCPGGPTRTARPSRSAKARTPGTCTSSSPTRSSSDPLHPARRLPVPLGPAPRRPPVHPVARPFLPPPRAPHPGARGGAVPTPNAAPTRRHPMTTTTQQFARPWREDSQFSDSSDFTLAEIATNMISGARYEQDPQAHLADVLPATFTYDEMRRITEYLAACTLDTSRLARIEARDDLD